jgi:DNA-directed RNA polymerase specialized sigma24 family protein
MRLPVEWLIEEYQMNLFVTAFQVCKNVEDAKDVVQDTFIAYYTSDLQYNDEQHIRAWLFRITVNKAKDVKKSFWHRNKMPLEDYIESLPFETKEDSYAFNQVIDVNEIESVLFTKDTINVGEIPTEDNYYCVPLK